MAWKTVSICRKVSDIVNVLQTVLGYSVTNLKNILVDELGYKSTKDILNRISISTNALYTPLVYRNKLGYSIMIKLVEQLLKEYESGEIKRIYCYHFWRCYSGSIDDAYLQQFRAEDVYEEHLKLLLKQHKFINYESPSYLP